MFITKVYLRDAQVLSLIQLHRLQQKVLAVHDEYFSEMRLWCGNLQHWKLLEVISCLGWK